MSTHVVTGYNGTAALGANVFVQVLNPDNGTVLQARSNGGIVERKAGCYTWEADITTELDAYAAYWDENDGVFSLDVVYPRQTVAVTVTTNTPLPITGDANGSLLALTFLIKRGDTKPYLRRQLVDTNGNAVPINDTDVVMFTMRTSTDVAMAGAAKVHAAAVIIDAAQGIVEYRWVSADTNTSTYVESSTLGHPVDTPYAAEFEVTDAFDGTVKTYPQSTYIAVSIPPDLDPGTNP